MTDAAPSAPFASGSATSAPPPRSGPTASDAEWHPGEAAAHEDPLLDALVILTQLHGNPFTAAALSAGLPLVDNRLTPSLLPRAAARAGLTARIVRKPADDILPAVLPAILLLNDRRACIMLERLPDGGARVRFPEAGESAFDLSADELAALYTGLVCFVRPRFRFEARAPQVKAARGGHWFWGTVFENWRLYRDTLLAALVVNLFALAIPMFSMTVYDRVVPNHAVETLWVLAIGAILVLGFDFMLRTLRAYIVDTAGKRIDVQLSARIMERVLGLRMDARPASVGSFASNLRAFEGVRDFIASATVTTLIDLPFVLLFLAVMAWVSPWLLVPPLVGMLAVLFVTLVAQDKMHELTETTYRASAQRNATLVESLVGLETLKTLGAESQVQRHWERTTLFIAQIGGRLKLLSSATVNFAQLMQQTVNIAVIIVGVYELSEGRMTMGGIIAASMLSGRAMAPLGQVAGLMMQYQNARTSLDSVGTHMNLPVERPEGFELPLLARHPRSHAALDGVQVSDHQLAAWWGHQRAAQGRSNEQRNLVVQVQQQIGVLAAEQRSFDEQSRQLDARFERLRTDRAATQARIQALWPNVKAKMWLQFKKDYVLWPLLGGLVSLLAGYGVLSGLLGVLLGAHWHARRQWRRRSGLAACVSQKAEERILDFGRGSVPAFRGSSCFRPAGWAFRLRRDSRWIR